MTAIQHHFPQGTVNYAIRKKIKKGDKILGIISKIKHGIIPKDQISITIIDGVCSKLRERIGCFIRKARSFVKRKQSLVQRLELFSVQHNFIEKREGETPAMGEGIMRKAVSWSEILHARLSYTN